MRCAVWSGFRLGAGVGMASTLIKVWQNIDTFSPQKRLGYRPTPKTLRPSNLNR